MRIQRTFEAIAKFKQELYTSVSLEHHMINRFPELAADISDDPEAVVESEEQLERWLKEV